MPQCTATQHNNKGGKKELTILYCYSRIAIIKVSRGQRSRWSGQRTPSHETVCICRDELSRLFPSILLARAETGVGEVGCVPEDIKDKVVFVFFKL
jgi:hypothetical protein